MGQHVNDDTVSGLLVLLRGRYGHVFRLALALPVGQSFGCLGIAALHRADYVVAYTHQSKTLLGRELADGIALDGAVSEIEFCYHIVLLLLIIYLYYYRRLTTP